MNTNGATRGSISIRDIYPIQHAATLKPSFHLVTGAYAQGPVGVRDNSTYDERCAGQDR